MSRTLSPHAPWNGWPSTSVARSMPLGALRQKYGWLMYSPRTSSATPFQTIGAALMRKAGEHDRHRARDTRHRRHREWDRRDTRAETQRQEQPEQDPQRLQRVEHFMRGDPDRSDSCVEPARGGDRDNHPDINDQQQPDEGCHAARARARAVPRHRPVDRRNNGKTRDECELEDDVVVVDVGGESCHEPGHDRPLWSSRGSASDAVMRE